MEDPREKNPQKVWIGKLTLHNLSIYITFVNLK